MTEPTSIEDRMWICEDGHKWKSQRDLTVCPGEGCEKPVTQFVPDWIDLPADLVDLFADALAEEISFFGGTKEAWVKVAKGVLTKAIRKAAPVPYEPAEVTPEEVHVIDLVLMPRGYAGMSRVEQVNGVIDEVFFWKEMSKELGSALEAIRDTKGLDETKRMREIADSALSSAAATIGG